MDAFIQPAIIVARLLTEHFLTDREPNHQLEPRFIATFGDSLVEPIKLSAQFGAQLKHLDRAGLPVPALGNSPDTTTPILFGSQWWTPTDFPTDDWRNLYALEIPPLLEIAQRSEIDLQQITPWHAANLYRDGLADTLATAAATYDSLVPAGGPPLSGRTEPPTSFVRCEVHTTTHGLALKYAPRYCHPKEWENFPADRLTSPSTGQILPGTYKFGAEGPEYKFKEVDDVCRIDRWDNRVFLPTL